MSYTKQVADGIKSTLDNRLLFGHETHLEHLIIANLARGHVLVEGPPGTAKTMTAKLLARLLSRSFNRIQFTTDLLPGDILGAHIFSPSNQEFVFVKGPIFSEFIVADEINRTPPRTQSALLEAMEERQVTVEGKSLALSPDFFVVATQNPQDHEGTFPLPEVQLDRFFFKMVVNHASPETEVHVIRKVLQGELPPPADALQPVAMDRKRIDAEIEGVKLDDSILRYITDLLAQTRKHSMLLNGSSVRGGIALARGTRVRALLEGRDYVTADDVKQLAMVTLRHRVRLNPEAQVSLVSTDDVLKEILEKVEFPA